MAAVAVFLRAINVGGRKLLTADFKRVLAQAGYANARTLGAAGTAVISAKGSGPALETAIEKSLQAELVSVTEVFARDGAELAATMAGNPFREMAEDDPSHLVVVFLRAQATSESIAALHARIVGRESVAAGPVCLYAAYPDGIGESKLTVTVIERALGDRGTARNWNTVRKLAELTASPASG